MPDAQITVDPPGIDRPSWSLERRTADTLLRARALTSLDGQELTDVLDDVVFEVECDTAELRADDVHDARLTARDNLAAAAEAAVTAACRAEHARLIVQLPQLSPDRYVAWVTEHAEDTELLVAAAAAMRRRAGHATALVDAGGRARRAALLELLVPTDPGRAVAALERIEQLPDDALVVADALLAEWREPDLTFIDVASALDRTD